MRPFSLLTRALPMLMAGAMLPACGPPLAGKLGPSTSIGVTVLEVADSTATYPEAAAFTLLADTAGATYVGRLAGTAPGEPRATLAETYAYLRDRANDLGADAYRVRERCAAAGPCRFVVDVYRAPDGTQHEETLAPDDVVVFGPLEGARDAPFKLNGEARSLPPLHYLVYANTGEEVKLSRGSFLTGASVTLRGNDGDPPSYWSTTGLSVGPSLGPGSAPGRAPGIGIGVGITLNSGRIQPVDAELGRFLVAVLHESDGDPSAAEG